MKDLRIAITLILISLVLVAIATYTAREDIKKLEQRIQVIEQRLDATDSGNGNVFNQDR